LDNALRTRRAAAPYRGVLVRADLADDFMTRCRAALATQDEDAAISHFSGAPLLDLPWTPEAWCAPQLPIHVTVPRDDDHRHRQGLRRHEALLPDEDVVIVDGIRCTSPARTLVDLARDSRMSAHRLLVVQMIDGARRFERCSPAQLQRVLAGASGLRNIRRAREWVGLSRDGVDSPPLSRRGWHVIRIVDTDLADPRGFILDWKQAVADAPARIAALDPGRSPEVAAARRALRIDRA
jgi:hypothetical protein